MLPRPVTSFQPSAIVSQRGVAKIFGWSEQTQARGLVDHVTDPRAREELHESVGRFAELEGEPLE